MKTVRQPAVAGTFYPADPTRLRMMVHDLLAAAVPATLPLPKALIAPHAGYRYSGPIAAYAYACLAGRGDAVRRVVMLGPAHGWPVRGLAASAASAFATPLGRVPVDQESLATVLALPQVEIVEAAHAREHALETQLPFLQTACPDFSLVPLLVGEALTAEVAELLEQLWDGADTLIVISSDLSHYHDYETARRLDSATARAIETLQAEAIGRRAACGRIPICALLQRARQRGLQAHTLDLRSSGDTAGSRDQVVGYGAFAFTPPASP